MPFERNSDTGELINPPTIQSFEQDISTAAAEGDNDRLQLIYEDYRKAQDDLANRLDKRESERDDDTSATSRSDSSVTASTSDSGTGKSTGSDKK
jgi:hypothetical protein